MLDVVAGLVSIATPVIAGAELIGGGLPGAAAALATYEAGQGLEAGISWTSTGLTALSNVADGTTGYDPNTNSLVIAQDTVVSASLSYAGGNTQDPLQDIVINGAQIGYDVSGYLGNTGPFFELHIPLP